MRRPSLGTELSAPSVVSRNIHTKPSALPEKFRRRDHPHRGFVSCVIHPSGVLPSRLPIENLHFAIRNLQCPFFHTRSQFLALRR
jgi:hypothetical protein